MILAKIVANSSRKRRRELEDEEIAENKNKKLKKTKSSENHIDDSEGEDKEADVSSNPIESGVAISLIFNWYEPAVTPAAAPQPPA